MKISRALESKNEQIYRNFRTFGWKKLIIKKLSEQKIVFFIKLRTVRLQTRHHFFMTNASTFKIMVRFLLIFFSDHEEYFSSWSKVIFETFNS